MSTTVVPLPAFLGEVLASADAAITNPAVRRARADITVAQALEVEERTALERSMDTRFPKTTALLADGEQPRAHVLETDAAGAGRVIEDLAVFLEGLRAQHTQMTAEPAAATQAGTCSGLGGACVADHDGSPFGPEDRHCTSSSVRMPDRYGHDFPSAELMQWTGDEPFMDIGRDTPELDLAGVDQLLDDLRQYTARLAGLRAQLARLQGGGR
ncbi:hypothetical protein GCM10010293_36720 [Streptomyces griseoflavus]|uniref:DUF6907 domain-containing protein n=1 Tax=Streptomyces griseoflavus TaxID=35619 RepID=UPI00167CFDC5|nr:hypothetical protein [Streptomyces griseoflavus]GGV34314.1 hypothetical protein GCM10010293_36720 [Streptomyces griseoflavus]